MCTISNALTKTFCWNFKPLTHAYQSPLTLQAALRQPRPIMRLHNEGTLDSSNASIRSAS